MRVAPWHGATKRVVLASAARATVTELRAATTRQITVEKHIVAMNCVEMPVGAGSQGPTETRGVLLSGAGGAHCSRMKRVIVRWSSVFEQQQQRDSKLEVRVPSITRLAAIKCQEEFEEKDVDGSQPMCTPSDWNAGGSRKPRSNRDEGSAALWSGR
ncbi:hypothetical protein B0H10DRAFT_1955887 [Mycena sp. CBHHK59/15]|nr:hypothetical protein B0H10DRAFT_1955887 [Mycena sp. CBHHK59/15]